MEDVLSAQDVLSVHKRPYDPERPVVCTGEMPRQRIREVYAPLPMESGKPKRHDYHCKATTTTTSATGW